MAEAIATYVADYYAFEVIGATVETAALIETATYVAATVAISAATSAAMQALAGRPTTTAVQLSTSIRQSDAPRRLIYGEVKAGGVLVYPAQSTDGKYCHLAIYLGEGPIDAVDPVIWIGDETSDAAKFDGLVTLEVFDGTQTAASAILIAASGGEWTADHIGLGCAWVHVRYEFDANAFPSGLILPAFLVRGRKVFDPRTNATAWSANPALVMLDYIRSEFGYAAADSWIDFDSFADAADVCDEVIDTIDTSYSVDGVSGKIRRYTCGGVFEASSSPSTTVAAIEASCAGRLVFCGGKYRFYAGAWRAPSGPVLTEAYLRGAPTLRTHPGRQQRYNIARGTYREPKQDWQSTDLIEQRLSAAVISDAGEIVQSADYVAVTCGPQAQRLARIAMRTARSAVPLQLPCNWAAFGWRLWDVVSVNLPAIGVDADYLVTEYTLAADGGIDMTLVPHLASDYAWTASADEQLVPAVTVPNFNVYPPAVTGLAVVGSPIWITESNYQVGLSATWDATNYARLDKYEIQAKRSDSSNWSIGDNSNVSSWSRYSGITAGVEYDVRVRISGSNGTTGPWSTETNITASTDTTPPGVPTNLSVTASGSGSRPHTISWKTPTDLDFSRSRVYASETNDSETSEEISEVFGIPGTQYSATHSPGTGVWYYWVTSVDRNGNSSEKTFAGSHD